MNGIKVYSMGELLKQAEVHEKEMDKAFIHDKQARTLTIMVAYPYEIDLDRIKTERDLLAWVMHLAEKNWIDTILIREFAERVAKIKRFKIHGC